eukprot:1137502-Pelagomonas_calceolata.AAC.4
MASIDEAQQGWVVQRGPGLLGLKTPLYDVFEVTSTKFLLFQCGWYADGWRIKNAADKHPFCLDWAMIVSLGDGWVKKWRGV